MYERIDPDNSSQYRGEVLGERYGRREISSETLLDVAPDATERQIERTISNEVSSMERSFGGVTSWMWETRGTKKVVIVEALAPKASDPVYRDQLLDTCVEEIIEKLEFVSQLGDG